jgi:glycosyltransferase involved in cell wall biosynthesis
MRSDDRMERDPRAGAGLSTARPTVLVYRNALLPFSETFIKEQVLAYRRWRGVLIGKHAQRELSLDGLDARMLWPVRSYALSRAWWKMSRAFDAAPSPVVAMLRREAPSLLHAHFGLDAVDAWPLARALAVPMLVTLHGYDINIEREWWEAGHWGRRFQRYPERLLALAASPQVHFVAVSQAIRRRAVAFGIPQEKISVHYIGVDSRRFVPRGRPIAERERRVLFVGRLVEKKGCEHLIRAMAAVQASVPDARLVIAGDGPLRDDLQRLAEALRVPADFRGALSSDQVRSELEQARVLCLPSITAANGDAEGFGLVLLEAQASGVPVVTSAQGGREEGVREGVTGFTFAERDDDRLAFHLMRILTDDNISASMAVAGPRFIAESFDLTQCTEALEMLYDVIAERASPAGPERSKAGAPRAHADAASS